MDNAVNKDIKLMVSLLICFIFFTRKATGNADFYKVRKAALIDNRY